MNAPHPHPPRLNQHARMLRTVEQASGNAKLIADLATLEAAAKRLREQLTRTPTPSPLFSWAGYALVNAMHDVTECDALYDMRNEIGLDLGVGADGERLLYLADRGVS